jgi:non-ribosomal peptide synthetase component E (peptide arylation enzyme)
MAKVLYNAYEEFRQVRVVDDDLKDVKPGEQGECLVKGNTIFM